ncbi:MAG: adenosylmethionine--8-amino-7-oxononanoate transaminase [Candidatus Competibacteraceae bacterium]|nr:adenosylmethionine--8-amino-7-oxononanoate transaminase [Candidatus Competibacteraceae bacterium]MBK8896083.1 adenosylmethionine--8-amino-7-oxononanoate transaminase [Candidatus Competibacteraceae bacterium]MBK8963502.1 adenosylmethionine--8-amino-7-oxononanoate transaminase [Candidatus Competibacteraceae bacterium]
MSNREWLDRSRAAVWHPCTQMKQHASGALPLVPIARGEGAWLYDFDGRRYLDAIGSWWVNLFGHANPRINAALKDQLDRLEHVLLAGFTHSPAVELSERLAALTRGELGHCFYASDGSSAVEITLKMSFHYWRNSGQPEKNQFLCLAGGYHGETLGTLSVGDVGLYRDAYAPLLRPAFAVPSPDARAAKPRETATDVAIRAAAALETCLAEHHGTIAAFILEPLVQGAGGMVMYDPHYLRLARELCDRYRVHLICDEIMVGFGRTGTFFAHEQAGIRPDFLTLSKGLTGGYLPLSAVMTTERVYAAFYDDAVTQAFLHSHSYTGNPLACRAALATLDIFARDDVIARNRRFAKQFRALLAPLAKHPRVRHFRQCGMIWAVDIDTQDPEFRLRFYREALSREVLLRPLGTTVYFMPPYILNDEEAALLAERAVAALDAALP